MEAKASSVAIDAVVRQSPFAAHLPALDPLLNTNQAAAYTGLTKASLQRDRTKGTGPKFIKLGKRRVAYRLSDIQDWLDARIAVSTSDARARGLATST